jgi:RNA polymerase sigma-70 factor (ECF subfamily)
MNRKEEKQLFAELSKDNEKAFEKLFHHYYAHLCVFASRILLDDESAEEIVQEFFVKVWEKRHQLSINSSVKNYFYRSVKNLCLNLIQHSKIKLRHAQTVVSEAKDNQLKDDAFFEIDLAQKIEESILLLPEKRRRIFKMSREEGLKYREIAEKLNISIKTVETQMSLAISTLKNKLKKYSSHFMLFCIFIKK